MTLRRGQGKLYFTFTFTLYVYILYIIYVYFQQFILGLLKNELMLTPVRKIFITKPKVGWLLNTYHACKDIRKCSLLDPTLQQLSIFMLSTNYIEIRFSTDLSPMYIYIYIYIYIYVCVCVCVCVKEKSNALI
jgi:hypothetical protein